MKNIDIFNQIVISGENSQATSNLINEIVKKNIESINDKVNTNSYNYLNKLNLDSSNQGLINNNNKPKVDITEELSELKYFINALDNADIDLNRDKNYTKIFTNIILGISGLPKNEFFSVFDILNDSKRFFEFLNLKGTEVEVIIPIAFGLMSLIKAHDNLDVAIRLQKYPKAISVIGIHEYNTNTIDMIYYSLAKFTDIEKKLDEENFDIYYFDKGQKCNIIHDVVNKMLDSMQLNNLFFYCLKKIEPYEAMSIYNRFIDKNHSDNKIIHKIINGQGDDTKKIFNLYMDNLREKGINFEREYLNDKIYDKEIKDTKIKLNKI